jgi:hypothetical protein
MSAEDRYSSKQVLGIPFDEVMRRALAVKPPKPKKKSRPRKQK